MGDDRDGAVPSYVYMEVADAIAHQIADGTLPVGARLPGEQDMAREHGIATHTARRAVRELRDRGLVATLPSKGTYVVAKPAGDSPDVAPPP